MTLGNMRDLGVRRLIASCLKMASAPKSRFSCARTDDELKHSMTSMHHG
jgi:hypothetical protein